MATAYSYLRRMREDSDECMANERAEVEEYYETRLKEKGFRWGGHFTDGADAFREPLFARPMGQKLVLTLERGDHLVVPRFDRAFRDTADFFRSFERCTAKGIRFSLLDLEIRDVGEELCGGFGVLSRLFGKECSRRSERAREAHVTRRARGQVAGSGAAYGFRLVGPKNQRRRVPDPEERAVMARIVEMRESTSLTWEKIALTFMRERLKRRNGCEWGVASVRNACFAELKLREAETEPPKKRCWGCGQNKPITAEHFNRSASEKDGYLDECRDCRSRRRRDQRRKRREAKDAEVIKEFHRKARRRRWLPDSVCDKAIEHFGSTEQFGKKLVEYYNSTKPGSMERINVMQCALNLAAQAARMEDDEDDPPA